MPYFAFVLILVALTASENISGCAGNVRVSREIIKAIGDTPNLSDIVVSLITSEGIVQEQTECSPQGYFFIPVYDIGDYTLSISKKDGWYVSPDSYSISKDDDDHLSGCESNLEFEITGFLVRGHTSNKHSSVPPQGLTIKLLSSDGFVLKTAETDSRGDYAFPNVVSGEYVIVAEHPSWSLDEPSRQVLSIGFGPAEIRTDFVVSGYRIAGKIENRSGVSSFEGVSLQFTREDGSVVGTAQPDPAGIFSLASLTDGIYWIIPAVAPGAPEWTVEPSKLSVRVRGDSVDLGTVFQITGFNLRGKVVDERGIPVEHAKIGVDSRETEVETGKDGTYVLAGMKSRLTAGNN
ncbi:uncharacterized protein [Blastocystis hominis]|uniref:ER membrane protein complex subunit 7 beta-sandwich domain-containing protein n=1 Tax=Blastocystis hominis TaxID=12968 RepID=D8M848_BLAHO|nr:uncharacterized protein [Blastocystis hominis]CBK24237.2 unnamed protein product [Blastocystis hominis]|eukprot:XP_012898285.1 uncharacterized protein [Blastocystis hominis]